MDRRIAAAWLAAWVAVGCGGGGGAAGEGTAGITPQPPPPAGALSANIAAWGDSLIPAVANNLQVMLPSRTVFNGGVGGETSTQVRDRMLADTSHRNWISVFWFGHNNSNAPSQIRSDMAAVVAALTPGNTRFIVMSLLHEATPSQFRGTPGYQNRMQINADLAATYPQNFLDIRAYLVSQYDPNQPQDVIDFNNDIVPSSLRHDEGHLNNAGSVLVARRVLEFISARGW